MVFVSILLLGPLADQSHPDSQTHHGRPFCLCCTVLYVEAMERAGRLRKGPSRMAGSSISGAEKDGQNCSQNVQIKNTHPSFDPSNTTTHVHACSHSFMSLSAPPHCGCTAVPTALPCPAPLCPASSSRHHVYSDTRRFWCACSSVSALVRCWRLQSYNVVKSQPLRQNDHVVVKDIVVAVGFRCPKTTADCLCLEA
ncbi:uncharacterized protein IWZ02DRAFT_456005 [Phyllosticta citriasiana]|uniref:uncharacterized protein n=1 Tax=Phyllosticta citriasiana TaxID=595635 RepID=UPI0030FDCBDA